MAFITTTPCDTSMHKQGAVLVSILYVCIICDPPPPIILNGTLAIDSSFQTLAVKDFSSN